MQIGIHKALSDEYPAIINLWEASVRATHDFLTERDVSVYRSMLTNFLPEMDIYSAIVNGSLQGFIGISGGKIHALFIYPTARRKGIGKYLVDYVVKDLEVTQVDANEQNKQALGFYEYLGFRRMGRSALDGAGKPYPILNLELVMPRL
ncbi:MAG: GNAT family N-acetyltransferase [Mucilaginibacter sp.]|nr:GNAT family N-acetyltransferase [Mucilaginibacter sp.]